MAGSDLVQALARGLAIVDRLADSPDGMGVQQLADHLQVSPPAAHNLLRTLMAQGWVERHDRPVRYGLGPHLRELAARMTAGGLRGRVKTALDGLAARLPDANWLFAEYLGSEIVGTMVALPRSGTVSERRGSPLGPYASASGLTYQAWCSAAERSRFRTTHPFSEFGAGLWADEATLDRFLADARSRGHVNPPRPEGSVRVGVPVLGVDGRLLGMLGGYWPCAPDQHTIHAARLAAELATALHDIHHPTEG